VLICDVGGYIAKTYVSKVFFPAYRMESRMLDYQETRLGFVLIDYQFRKPIERSLENFNVDLEVTFFRSCWDGHKKWQMGRIQMYFQR
jgi:hypothetical protein